jgi:hypothetical protein
MLSIYGLVAYFEGPKEIGSSKIEFNNDIEFSINSEGYKVFSYLDLLNGNDSLRSEYIYYNAFEPLLIVNGYIEIFMKNPNNKTLDMYLMDSKQYNNWVNNGLLDGLMIKRNINILNICFNTYHNGTLHYLVLINKGMQIENIKMKAIQFIQVRTFDYSKTFNKLLLIILGWLILIITFAILNPLGRKIRIKNSPEMDEYYNAYENKNKIGITVSAFIFSVTILSFWYIMQNMPYYSPYLPQQIALAMKDFTYRFELFNLANIFFLLIGTVIALFTYSLLTSYAMWLFCIKLKIYPIRRDKEELAMDYLLKELASFKLLLIYILTIIFACISLKYGSEMTFVNLPFVILSPILGYILANSNYKVFKKLNLDYKREMEIGELDFSKQYFIGLFIFLLILLFMKCIALIDSTIFNLIVANSIAYKYHLVDISNTGYFSFTTLTEMLFDRGFVYVFPGWVGIIGLSYMYFNIGFLPLEDRKKKSKLYLQDLFVFIFTYINTQVLLTFSAGMPTTTSLFYSITTSFIGFLISKYSRQVLASI